MYGNFQPPGTLWYHDHSMGTTSLNVRLGLHAFYLLRNPTVEADLPTGEFERIIYMYGSPTVEPFGVGSGSDNPSLELDCTTECANGGGST